MSERAILLIVPGRTDRAFYKAFIREFFKNVEDTKIQDLDKRDLSEFKEQVLSKILPYKLDTRILARNASLMLEYKDMNKVYVIIMPSRTRVTQEAQFILEYFAGIQYYEGIVDSIIIIEDAEDKSFEEQLNDLYQSITSRIRLGNKLSEGKYYRCYTLLKHNNIKVCFMVQGLEEIFITNKHAIEDFIIYVYQDELLSRSLKPCIDTIKSISKKDLHKKLAELIALSKCYYDLESFIFKAIPSNMFEKLVQIHDGLRMIIGTIKLSKHYT